MRGRSHRLRVPTARPPSDALGVVYVWGRGVIGADLRAYLHKTHASIAERDDIARALAIDHGCPIDMVPDTWAWRVDHTELRKLDALTRSDPAVMGWTQYQRETCPPSLALRNALNAMSRDEVPSVTSELEARFAAPGRAHLAGDPNQWVARDNRIVFFDPERDEWRLADYAST